MRSITTRRGVRVAVMAATAVGALTLTAFTSPAGAHVTRDTTAPGADGSYAVNEPLCAQPESIYANRCLGLRRVTVAKGTRGAYRITPDAGSGPNGGITPAQLATAYGFNPATKAGSQTVGIIDWYDDPNVLADLKHYDAHYHLGTETSTSFRKVNQRGATKPLPKKDHGSSGEIALDVESVRAVCHSCRILLVEADSPTDASTAAAENLAVKMGATEVSNSFGGAEHKVSAAVLAAYRHPGVVITASSGDDGWYSWDRANNSNGTSANAALFPATDPDVVAVGGTGLELSPTNHRSYEYVWNDNGADDQDGFGVGSQGASGGGCSKYFTAQAFQSAYKGYSAAGCKGKRLSVDIAALADPKTGFSIYDTYGTGSNGWVVDGGTSLAAPLTAAMFALRGGSGGAVYPAASLYVNGTHRASSLFDVTDGGNGFCAGDTTYNCGEQVDTYSRDSTYNPNALGGGNVDCSFPRSTANVDNAPTMSSECNAAKGYDGPSGLGTPKASTAYAPANPAVSISHAASLARKKSLAFTAKTTARVSGSKAGTWTWAWGDGTKTTTHSASTHHTYGTAGTKAVSVSVSDNLHQTTYVRAKLTIRS